MDDKIINLTFKPNLEALHSITAKRVARFGPKGEEYVRTGIMPEGLSPEDEERFLKLRTLEQISNLSNEDLMGKK